MKTRNWTLPLTLLAVVLLGFNMYGAYKKQAVVRPVPCLDPEVFLEQHKHATLQILVDAIIEELPADIGITEACNMALHTHDASGTVHVEAQDMHAYTLGEFFRVWGKPIKRNGYILTTIINTKNYEGNAENIVLEDEQEIILSYVRIP